MNSPAIHSGLRPTWRMQWQQLRVHHDAETNRRAERLVMRGMDRHWKPARLEHLLGRLMKRAAGPRALRNRHSLPRANGGGLAGQCPASHAAKTTGKKGVGCHFVAAGRNAGDDSARATLSRPVSGGVL